MNPSTSKAVAKIASTEGIEAIYPRNCALCNSQVQYYDQSDFGRHLRLAHATKEGGSFICRYGENGVCQKLPLEGVSDYDYEAHIRKFHTGVEMPERNNRDPKDVSERPFTINSTVQSVWSAVADPSRSRSEVSSLLTRDWGEAFVPHAPISPSPLLTPLHVPTARSHLEHSIKIYKKFAHTKRVLKKQRQLAQEEKADVSGLPPLLLETSFDLSIPDAFSAVFLKPSQGSQDPLTSHAVATRSTNPFDETSESPSLSTNPFEEEWRERAELQKRLEVLHDTVDARLSARLRAKTDAFFRIVSSYSSLQKDIQDARQHIGRVRSNLSMTSQLILERTDRTMRVQALKEKKLKLLDKLRDMTCLRDAQQTVQGFLSQGEYPRALECIQSSQHVLAHSLGGVVAFRHLNSQMSGLREAIGKLMQDDLVQAIQTEFGSKVDEPGAIVSEGELSCVVLGLAQLRSFSFVRIMKHEMGEAMRVVLRGACKEAIVERGDLAALVQVQQAVASLPFSHWLRLLHSAHHALFSFQLRIETLQRMLLELLDRVWPDGFPDEEGPATSTNSPSPSPAPEEDDSSDDLETVPDSSSAPRLVPSSAILPVDIRSLSQLRRSLSCLLPYAIDFGDCRLARLLLNRCQSDERRREIPPMAELASLSAEVAAFIREGEGRGWRAGRGTNQVEAALERAMAVYVDSFHRSRKETISQVLDGEMWRAAEIPEAVQTEVDRFVRKTEGKVVETEEEEGGKEEERKKKGCSHLLLHDEQFVVVSSAALTVAALVEHAECAEAVPASSARLLLRTVELLKMFNSRCCQLILGAGALHLVGLKTISVKNLALASRSLQLLAACIPLLQASFAARISPENTSQLRYFQQVHTDYHEHVKEIVSKLVSVIDHHTSCCLSSWSPRGAPPSSSMQQICRQLSKFHQGVHGIAPPSQIQELFLAVHENFKRSLREQFSKLSISPHDTLAYGIVCEDYNFYARSVCGMAGCERLQLGSIRDALALPA